MRHYSLSLENFRRYFPVYKARGYAVMYYIFPYVKRVLVELRKDNPDLPPTSRRRWTYRNRFWRKYGPAVTLWIERNTKSPKLRALADKLHFFLLRQGLVLMVRSDRTWPHAQIIYYPREPGDNKYLFSMWAFREGGFFDVLDEYCNFCLHYEKSTGYRCNLPSVGYAISRDVEALFSYSWEGADAQHRPRFHRGAGMGGVPAPLQRVLQRPARRAAVQPDAVPDPRPGQARLRHAAPAIRRLSQDG